MNNYIPPFWLLLLLLQLAFLDILGTPSISKRDNTGISLETVSTGPMTEESMVHPLTPKDNPPPGPFPADRRGTHLPYFL